MKLVGIGASGSLYDFFCYSVAGTTVWSGAGFVAWVDANYQTYRVAATELGLSGRFTGTAPAGTVSYEMRPRGATLALSPVVFEFDSALVHSGTGTGEINIASGVAESNLTQIIGATAQTIQNGNLITMPCDDQGSELATTIIATLARIGAFTGSGVNTVLGFLRAMANKVVGIATPSDLVSGGGTFTNTTDAMEAVRDQGDAAWVTATSVTIASGGISTSSFTAGAINAAAIATDALGALELGADAASEIAAAVAASGGLTAAQSTKLDEIHNAVQS